MIQVSNTIYRTNRKVSLREKNGIYFVFLSNTKVVYEVSKLGAAILQESKTGLSRDRLFKDLKCEDSDSELTKKIDEFIDSAISSELLICKQVLES